MMLSRVADSLYWMSRYLERAEHTARLVDVYLTTALDRAGGISLTQRRTGLLQSLKVKHDPDLLQDDHRLSYLLTFDEHNDSSILSAITASRENARQVREQISSEMWAQINRLYLQVKRAQRSRSYAAEPHEFYMLIKEGSHLFQGITDATMNHGQGWHFIQLGRLIERTIATARLLDVHLGALNTSSADSSDGQDYFEHLALLKSVTAFEAYCKVYQADLRPIWIAEFLLFSAEFPRSIRFCVDMLLHSLDALSEATQTHKHNRLHRLVGRLRSTLNYTEISEVLPGNLNAYLQDIKNQTEQIHDNLVSTYVTYPIETAIL